MFDFIDVWDPESGNPRQAQGQSIYLTLPEDLQRFYDTIRMSTTCVGR